MLLRPTPHGFLKVDGEGNDACPNVFSVPGDSVEIGGRKVGLGEIDRYLKNRPRPIPFP